MVRLAEEFLNPKIVSAPRRQLEAEFERDTGCGSLFNMIRFAQTFPDWRIVQSLIAQLGGTRFTSAHLFALKTTPRESLIYTIENRC